MFSNFKNFIHLIRIARTLARHDALFPVDMMNSKFLSFVARMARRKSEISEGQRLVNAFTELGPTFIKLGQGMSTRSDFVGEDMARRLAVLQDQIPPFASDKAISIVEEELGGNIELFFQEFDGEPIAAASIAQVHFAKTLTGEDVAVKILRPNIRKQIDRDLRLMFWIADLIEKINPAYAKRLKPREVVDTLEQSIRFELDLTMEAASASLLGENFADWEGFYVPQVYWSLTTANVLVTERINGIKIESREAIVKAGFDPDEILKNSSQALFKQVFEDGFFHADLHPGNVFVNTRGEIVPIDFGIMGHIDRDSRIYIAEILAGFLTKDYDRVAKAHFEAGYVPKHKAPEAFALACRSVGEPVMNLPTNEISIARLLGQMFKVADDFEMETQPQLLLMQKTMMMAEGLGRILNPEVNMWELAEPLVEKWINENMGVKAKAFSAAEDAKDILLRIPEIIRKLDKYLDEELDK